MKSIFILCPVSSDKCLGRLKQTENKTKGLGRKGHSSYKEVLYCQKKFLLNDGYVQIGRREFLKEGQPILVLSKKPGRLSKPGKEGTRVSVKGVCKW